MASNQKAVDNGLKDVSKTDHPGDSEDPNTPTQISEIGTTGLKQYGGRIEEEWLRQLKGINKYKIYQEMRDNDPVIGAILFTIDMLIRQVKWNIAPASEDPADIENAEFLESCMDDMSSSWENVISEILSFLWAGFSYHEIVYKKRSGSTGDSSTRSNHDDGRIGWRKLPIRAQTTLDHWNLDETGGINGFVQIAPPTIPVPTEIPIEKGLLFRTRSYKGNPEGRSVIRNAYRPWFFKKRIEEIEGIGIERDLAGLPVIYVPNRIMSSNANTNEKAIYTEVQNIVSNIRRDEQEGVVMPGDRDDKGKRLYELELLSSGGSRQFNTNEIIGRYEQRIAMTVLADFILLGHEKVGSFALSDNKTDLFVIALAAWLDEIKSVFNRHAIPRLFALNGVSGVDLPTLEYGDIESPNLASLGEYINKLTGAGVPLFPDLELENYLRRAANLPEAVEEDDGLDSTEEDPIVPEEDIDIDEVDMDEVR